MNRQFWAHRVKQLLEQGKSVQLCRASMKGEPVPLAVVDQGKVYFFRHRAGVDDNMVTVTHVIDQPAQVVEYVNRIPWRCRCITVQLPEQSFTAFNPRQESTARYLTRRICHYLRQHPDQVEEPIRFYNDLAAHHQIQLSGIPLRIPYNLFSGHPPVRPGETFVLEGVPHRLESRESVIARNLYRLIRVALRQLMSVSQIGRYLCQEAITVYSRPQAVPDPSGMERVLIPYGLSFSIPDIHAVVTVLCSLVSGVRLPEWKWKKLDILPGRQVPVWYPIEVTPDTLVRRGFRYAPQVSVIDPIDDSDLGRRRIVNSALYYWHGLVTRCSPLLSAVMQVDIDRATAELYTGSGHLPDIQFPVARRLRIRHRGIARIPMYAYNNHGSYDTLLSLPWRNTSELLNIVRLYLYIAKHRVTPSGNSVYISLTGLTAWDVLCSVITQALPSRITVAELAGLLYYIGRRDITALLENALPEWRDGYQVAMDLPIEGTVDEVSDVVEWLLSV